jgi:hypothetical protein
MTTNIRSIFQINTKKQGFILLFTVVVISITVGLSTSLLVSATRQTQLGTSQSDVQSAFYAADTGSDCGLAWVYYVDDIDKALTCAGKSWTKDPKSTSTQSVYFFDFSNSTSSTTETPLWSSTKYGGMANSCGVVVITTGSTLYVVESYGYSICYKPATTTSLRPDETDPAQVERKIIVEIPITEA